MEEIDEILNRYGIGELLVLSAMQVKKKHTKMCAQVINEQPLNQNEVDILLFLKQHREVDTAAEIAKYRCVSKSQICKSVDDLTRQGYLIVIPDEKDRRYQHLSLSEKGNQILIELEEVRKVFLSKLENGITGEERKMFQSVIKKIRQNVMDL